MSEEAPASVSDWDREYMRRIGRYKHESHQEAIRAHRELPANARLAIARRITADCRAFPTWDHRIDDPSPFYERAKALGMYRA